MTGPRKKHPLQRLTDIVANIQYKPGWEFRLIPSQHRIDPVLRITAWVIDASGARMGGEISIVVEYPVSLETIDALPDEVIVRDLIGGYIMQLEQHEMREWYRYHNKHITDPHPELKPRPLAFNETGTIPVNY